MKKHQVHLPRREFLKMGGAGVLGMFIAAATLDRPGTQAACRRKRHGQPEKAQDGRFQSQLCNAMVLPAGAGAGLLQGGRHRGLRRHDIRGVFARHDRREPRYHPRRHQRLPGLRSGQRVAHQDDLDIPRQGMVDHGRSQGHRKARGPQRRQDYRREAGRPAIPGSCAKCLRRWGSIPTRTSNSFPYPVHPTPACRRSSPARSMAPACFRVIRRGSRPQAASSFTSTFTRRRRKAFGAMGGWLAKNEDTAYAWARADIRARKWLFDPANKDQAYKTMRDLGFAIPPAFEAQYKLELDQISPDGGFESAEVMDKFVESLAATGRVPKGPRLAQICRHDLCLGGPGSQRISQTSCLALNADACSGAELPSGYVLVPAHAASPDFSPRLVTEG